MAASRFIFAFWKVYNDCYRCFFPLRPSREKANRENSQIFPIGKYKQYSAKIAQSAAEGIFISSHTEVFPQKIGKRIASFVCFLYNKGKIN